EVVFFNNVGQPEGINIKWSSDNEEVAMVSEGGLLWARVKGNTTVTAIAEYEGETVTVEKNVVVDQETVAAEKERKGSLRSTSTYNLKGDFILTENEGGVTLSFSEDYKTDDVLPGLFIYLTNNPSTIKDALEISEVTTFDGAHSYDILDVKLNDYSHVLYFCKPFNVKVGDGALE
ncbi:MAG: DM13 domain-containing protein, partial [Saprospiraceae bacterium]